VAKQVKVIVKLVDNLTGGLGKMQSRLHGFATKGAAVVSKLTKSFVRLAKVGIAGAAAGFAAIISKSVQTAASYQALQTRLEAVLGAGQNAEKVFKEIRKFAASTPLQLEDLIKAKILLESVGTSGMASLKGVAAAAATMGRSVEDVALAVTSLESESLKKLGIQLRTSGEEFTFNFRDKAGDAVTTVVNGVEEAREALTGIFGEKFGAGLKAASEDIAGQWSTFKDNVNDAFAVIGTQLLPVIEKGLNAASEAIKGLIADGTLERFGQKIADVFGSLERLPDKIRDAFNSLTPSGFVENVKADFRLGQFETPRVPQRKLDQFGAGTNAGQLLRPGELEAYQQSQVQTRFGYAGGGVLDVNVRNVDEFPAGGLQ